MLALVVCEEGDRGLATPQSSKWGDYKRESQPEKGKRGRGGTFSMHRPSMDVPGKRLLDVVIQKGIKSHFPGSVEDWAIWHNGKRAQVLSPEVSQRFPCPLTLSVPTPLILGLCNGLVYENWNVNHWTGLWDSRDPSVPVSI